MSNSSHDSQTKTISRRTALKQAAGLAAVTGLARTATANEAARETAKETDGPAVRKGRINQSIVHWCFGGFGEKWSVEQTSQVAKQLGCKSIELVPPSDWPTLRKYGLTCAIAGIDMSPDKFPFLKGFNNPKYWPKVIAATNKAIDEAAEGGVKNVIAFTGMRENISDEAGLKNCVAGFKKVVGHAEKKGVTLCLEMLNTRDDTHPMKGHPGYQGDSTEYCIDIIKQVGSPRLKLLFDIYHVQIMDGDVIRRIHQHKDYLGHIHTAGNPGRGELDADQEINYPAVMKALLEVGYKGFVGQEFIPTRDPLAGLRQAVAACDV